ncbi:MAG: SCO family protein [Betaproteobacteria bacterium]|nr:SCO family protein [Betaproteobacteria bacterium]
MAPLAPASLLLGAMLACAAAAAQEMNVPDAERAVGISQAVIGKPVGDHAFTDRLHRNVRLADYRGKPLVVSFIYTSCFQVCPATTQFLARAVAAARQALGNDSFQVVSIGFNQPFDNPDALAAFARKAGVDDPRWEFLAPPAPDVPALARDFGFTYYATPKGFDHLTQLTVVDAEGGDLPADLRRVVRPADAGRAAQGTVVGPGGRRGLGGGGLDQGETVLHGLRSGGRPVSAELFAIRRDLRRRVDPDRRRLVPDRAVAPPAGTCLIDIKASRPCATDHRRLSCSKLR